jgi:hypothetical protein
VDAQIGAMLYGRWWLSRRYVKGLRMIQALLDQFQDVNSLPDTLYELHKKSNRNSLVNNWLDKIRTEMQQRCARNKKGLVSQRTIVGRNVANPIPLSRAEGCRSSYPEKNVPSRDFWIRVYVR